MGIDFLSLENVFQPLWVFPLAVPLLVLARVVSAGLHFWRFHLPLTFQGNNRNGLGILRFKA